MEKKQLNDILGSSFKLNNWNKVVVEIFAAKRLFNIPKSVKLNSNNKAEEAYELGNFSTADDRIIGLYHIKLNDTVRLERNKVGIRELLRSVYKYEVDGALIVFEQNEKWRLSFVSEIRTFDEQGHLTKQTTEPKRYTYLLGKGERVRTPTTRLMGLIGKTVALEDIRNAFSVEALNEEFYKIVARHFYQLVGATEGKGIKSITYDRVLQLPLSSREEYIAQKIYQEFAVRLIGRTVFCWFLKVKKSELAISLLPEHLLSSEAVKNNNDYYHSILEKLFFQTLNTPMDKRIDGLPYGCDQIPFLNGGLFEIQADDYYKPNRDVSFSETNNGVLITDEWFISFFESLEQYNFTIDENSVVDIEVSVDPEMLGRIFENLLAEIDPDSGETARKATGSFYTPREIVDYMVTETLVNYLNNETGIDKESLYPIFRIDSKINFANPDIENILDALDRLKMLDPACGSGAFPMGMLQKIVMALQKIDPNSSRWKAKQVEKIENIIFRKQVKEKLEQTTVEYARKIGIIQRTLYGIDIQPIAVELSKLRCFLTLVVDENIDETKSNRGVEPLPNLEFKFVAANTLSKLTKERGIAQLSNNKQRSAAELEKELHDVRQQYLQSSGEEKLSLKQSFLRIQKQIFDQQGLFGILENSRAYQISTWNPFSHEKADWFDSLWMFGISEFDIVIGNPPYVLLQNTTMTLSAQEQLRKKFKSAQYKTDLFHLFIEQGVDLTKKPGGILCYITPNTYLKNKHNNILRELLVNETQIKTIIRFSVPIFKNASVDNSIIITEHGNQENNDISVIDVASLPFEIQTQPEKKVPQSSIQAHKYLFDFDTNDNEFLSQLKYLPKLNQYGRAYFGIQTFDRDKFVSKNKITESYVPVVDGTNVNRYFLKKPNEFVCFDKNAIKSGGNPSVYERERILVRQIGKYPEACFCPPGIYTLNTIYNIFTTSDSIKLKFLLGIINSKLIQYYWIKVFFDNKETFPKIKKEPLESLPIVATTSAKQKIVINLVEYILLLNNLGNETPINEYVPNSHIAHLFEDVIDALVYELYFEEDFQKADIAFMKYTEDNFKSIEDLNEKDAIKAIQSAYKKLLEKDDKIRQNLKLIDTRLPNLIIPIKTAK